MLPAVLITLLRRHREYDLIFVSGFRVLGLAAVLAGKLLGKKSVLKADSLGEMSGEFFAPGLARRGFSTTQRSIRAFLSLRNRILRRADAFVAISSAVAAELVAHGVDSRLIYPIPNGVDTQRFSQATPLEKKTLRRQLGLPQSATIVTYSGRLVSYKGLALLLEVWCEILNRHKNARLLLVGSGGLDLHNCEAELKAFVRTHHLEKYVFFTGDVQNVADYLRASDIFAFPVENEAFGIALIEAMACGLPAVATAVGGVEDIVRQGQNGLLVQPGDFQQLQYALEVFITHPHGASRLGHAARQTVQQCYAADAVTNAYAELFDAISHERKEKKEAAPAT